MTEGFKVSITGEARRLADRDRSVEQFSAVGGAVAAERVLATAGAHPVYFTTAPDPTFATVHVPRAGCEGATGVIICPSFGWSDDCTYRARLAWAQRLSDAGCPTVRFDLPGMGDSVGSLDGPDRLHAWTSAVTAIAGWLRRGLGCREVTAIGIGFGGMLAWLSAVEGAPIDDLVLWGVPVRGGRLVRELRVAAQVEIDFELTQSHRGSAPGDEQAGGLLDESGQLIPEAVLDSLTTINLRQLPLPHAERRRVLFLARSGVSTDADFVAYVERLGAQVTVGDGDSYGAMMRYVQDSVIPREVIDRSVGWVTARDSNPPSLAGGGDRPVTVSRSAEFAHNGVAIREAPHTFQLSDCTIRVIVSQAVHGPHTGLGVVFFSGGCDRRTGPNRMWVEAARRWAALGVSAIRLDLPGIGDSEGDDELLQDLRSHFDPLHIRRARELLDAAQEQGLASRFVLAGFCSGAHRSIHAAVGDPRVSGVVALGLPFFHWTWWTVNVRDSWLAVRRPKPEDSALKLRVVGGVQRCLTTLKAGHHVAVILTQALHNRGERMIDRLTANGTEVVFVCKPSSYTLQQLSVPLRRLRMRRNRFCRVYVLPGNDARFRPLASQRLVADAMDASIDELLTRYPPRAPSDTSTARSRAFLL